MDDRNPSRNRDERIAVACSGGTIGASLVLVAVGWFAAWGAQVRLTPGNGDAYQAVGVPTALAMKSPIDGAAFVRGKQLFTSCVVCHGPDARGIKGLGKDLTSSYFVSSETDEALVAFLKVGRDAADPKNTSKVAMPARGGNMALTDQHLGDVVAFMRGLQSPERLPKDLPDLKVGIPMMATAPAPKGANDEETAWIASGMKIFNTTCIACHGAGGTGVKGSGKALAKSPFIASQDDKSLLAFLKKGRDPSDPANTTGVGMPAKGGNPALSEDDLLDVISYLRALQEPKAQAAAR